MSYKWFKPETDPLMVGLSPELLSKADTAASVAKAIDPSILFRITSGLRTCAGNDSVGGVEHSSHIQGLGMDFGLGHLAEGYDRDHARFLMKAAFIQAGFHRIGSYDLHIHVDVGQAPDYTQDVEWQKAGQ